MKYKPQQYAAALYESLKDKTNKEVEGALDNFSDFLKKNRDTALARKIATAFERYALGKEGIVSGELVSARALDDRLKSEMVKKLTRQIKAEELILKEKIDEDIIGGFKIKAGDVFLDASVKGILAKIRRKVLVSS